MNSTLAIWVILAELASHGLPHAVPARGGLYPYRGTVPAGVCPPQGAYFRRTISYHAVCPSTFYFYGRAIRRPYRYTRAVPAHVVTPEVGPALPLRIRNPFVTTTAGTGPGRDPMSTGPLRIINPYAVKLGDPGISSVAILPRRPQVVHPSAMVVPSE